MKVALVQYPIAWEDKEANFARVRELLSGTDFPEGKGLIVLPELFADGFTMNSEAIAEPEGGSAESFLIRLAVDTSAHVIGGIARANASGLPSNCAVIASPSGEILCRYEKTHPFSLGGEGEHYRKGTVVETIEIEDTLISPSVCYDLRFPEVYRIGAHCGAEVYVVIANWPEKRNEHWRTLLRARAIENQAFVIGVNRCGEDPNLSYLGSSMLVNHMGEIVAEAPNEPTVIEGELDLASLREWRENFPALRDMHDDLSN